jgi:choline kinase
MPDSAVIVAAGLSSRLYPLTIDTPKGLLPLGGESLIGRSIRLLRENGVSRIAVVVGYQAGTMRAALGPEVTLIPNPFYRHCNNMGSLFFARDFVGNEPFAYLHGDLVYTSRMLGDFLTRASQASGSSLDLLVAMGEKDEEAMKVRIDGAGHLIESNKQVPLDEAAGEWTGIGVGHDPGIVFAAIEKYLLRTGLDDYDTAAFTALAAEGKTIRCIPSNGDPWKEIDTMEDLESARATFGRPR